MNRTLRALLLLWIPLVLVGCNSSITAPEAPPTAPLDSGNYAGSGN